MSVSVVRVNTIVTTLKEITNAAVTKDTSYSVQINIAVSVSEISYIIHHNHTRLNIDSACYDKQQVCVYLQPFSR